MKVMLYICNKHKKMSGRDTYFKILVDCRVGETGMGSSRRGRGSREFMTHFFLQVEILKKRYGKNV